MTAKRTHRIDGTIGQLKRRHFLLGAGGFALSIPFLESLDQEAQAGVPPFAANPRFVAMTTRHGAVWPDNMFPLENTTPNAFDVAPGHAIHHGDLQLTSSSGVSSLSPVLAADSGALTASLASKMMVLRGLDVMWYIGHNAGGALGNYRAHDGDTPVGMVHRPTIDQVMAWSSSFYPDLQTVLARSMHIGETNGGGMSWGYANPATQSGGVSSIPTSQKSLALFNQIFVPPTDPSVQQRPLVVDRVVESYRRLRNGVWGASARLSAADRQKLDDQMERFLELERKLGVPVDCSSNVPTDEAEHYAKGSTSKDVSELTKKYQLYNDVIASAFICGTSRIATISSPQQWYDDFSESWHDVAHTAVGSSSQARMVESHNNFFKAVFLDLCNKLDVDEGNGKTALDNSLVMWSQECGEITHWSASVPVVTAGSAAGYFNTGKCYDYRNRNNMELTKNTGGFLFQQIRPGLSYNQWLANVLQSVNVPPSEFAWPGETGYGDPHRGPIKSTADPFVTHPDYVVADMNAPLPFIKA